MKCSLKYVLFGAIISGLVISPAAARRLFQRHCCTKQCAQACSSSNVKILCPPACGPTPCEPVDCVPVDCATTEIVDGPEIVQDFTIEPAPAVEAPVPPVVPEAKEELETPGAISEAAVASDAVAPIEPIVEESMQPTVDTSIAPTVEAEPVTPNVVGDRYATEPIALPEPAPIETTTDEPASNAVPFVEKEPDVETTESATFQEPEAEEPPVGIFDTPSESSSVPQDVANSENIFGPSSSEPQKTEPTTPAEQPTTAEQPKRDLPVFQSPKSIESPTPQPKSQPSASQQAIDPVFGPSSTGSAEKSPTHSDEKSKEIEQPKKNKQPEPKTPAQKESDESYSDPFDEGDVFTQNEQTTILSEPGGLYSSTARTWTDKTATHECEARLVHVTSSRVILERPTGAKLSVPFARMADGDLHFVREQLTALRIVQARKADAEKLASVTSR